MERDPTTKVFSNQKLAAIAAKYGGRTFFHQGYFPPGTDLSTRDIRNLEGAQIEYLRELVTWLEPTAEDYVLEIGCGAGQTAIWLAKEFGCRVLGVDLVEVNCERARGAVRAAGLDSRIEIRAGDILEALLPERAFTRILSVEAAYYVQNKPALFDKASRWIVPGGRMVLAEYTLRERCPWLSAVIFGSLYGSPHLVTQDAYRKLLSAPPWRLRKLRDVSDCTLVPGFALADLSNYPMVTEMAGALLGNWVRPLVPLLFRHLVRPRIVRGDIALCFLRADHDGVNSGSGSTSP